ncbi:MAG: FlgD immunoglobulin-like domain containing protein, partial [Candidatus Latescibacterota bacterium]
QRYDPLGNRVGTEFPANTYTAMDQSFATAAMRDDGSFLIAWQSTGQDGDGRGVFARLYDSAGNPVGEEFQVNTFTYSNQAFPHVAVNPVTNGFVLTWSSAFQDDSHDAAIVRLYDHACNPVTNEIQANEYTFSFQGFSRVDCDASGDFVVVWTSYQQDGSEYTVVGRRFRDTGAPLGNEFIINQYTDSHQDYPDVAVAPGGSFVVVWHSALQDGSSYGVYGRRYNDSGQPIGGEFQINDYITRNQWWPKIAMDHFGSYTVVWQSDNQDGSSRGVFARRYRSDHTTHTNEFAVNTRTNDDQDRPAIASDPAGNLVVVWQSENQDGGGLGIYGQRIETGTVPAVFANIFAEEAEGAVRIQWEVAADLPIAGFTIHRGTNGSHIPVATMLPSGQREFLDVSVTRGVPYTYTVEAVDANGDVTLSPGVTIELMPLQAGLSQNHPNPFHPRTTFDYTLPQAGMVDVRIYDARGRLVVSLESSAKPAGRHSIEWDGRNAGGMPVSSGVYYYRLTTGNNVLTKKMILIK